MQQPEPATPPNPDDAFFAAYLRASTCLPVEVEHDDSTVRQILADPEPLPHDAAAILRRQRVRGLLSDLQWVVDYLFVSNPEECSPAVEEDSRVLALEIIACLGAEMDVECQPQLESGGKSMAEIIAGYLIEGWDVDSDDDKEYLAETRQRGIHEHEDYVSRGT